MYISNTLISWYSNNKRDLPWRKTKDPYQIWLSEIILQQTRVEQGLPYFLHFQSKYPTVKDLALASEDEVMRSWQGLGYYSRARNLHAAAKQVHLEFNGIFPKSYLELIKLRGVGEYTAAAIASFAYNEVTPVLDGNVFRFLSRYFGIHTPINASNAKKEYTAIAQELIDPIRPDTFNQAIMEFGALQCKPKSPDCSACPLNGSCEALKTNEVDLLPIKDKKGKRTTRYFYYFLFQHNHTTAIIKRTAKDIWQSLYEFPMFESKTELEEMQIVSMATELKLLTKNSKIEHISPKIKHVLSHQDIYARFFKINDPHFQHQNRGKYLYIKDDKLMDFAFPRLIEQYLQK